MAHVIQAGHLVRIPDRAQGRAANLSRSSPCSSADRASASGAVCTGSSPVRGASRRRASAQFRAFSARPDSPGFPQFPAGARCAWTGLGQEPGHGVSTISSSRKVEEEAGARGATSPPPAGSPSICRSFVSLASAPNSAARDRTSDMVDDEHKPVEKLISTPPGNPSIPQPVLAAVPYSTALVVDR